MKSILLSLFIVFSAVHSYTQPKDEATKWSFSFSKEELKKGDEIDVVVNVNIEEGFYIYSMYYDCAPIPTTIKFEENEDYQIIGEIQAIGDKKKFDDIFECEYNYFKEKATYIQKVKVLNNSPSPLTGTYDYQACNDSKCIPYFGNKFSISTKNATKKKKDQPKSLVPINTTIKEPITNEVKTDLTKTKSSTPSIEEDCERKAGFDDIEVIRFSETKEKPNTFKALLLFAGISFIAGLLALLTPCVFPMIPMTVSFFTHSSKSRGAAIRKGVLYGSFIIIIYTLLGTLVAYLFGPSFANTLATSWSINLLFFAIFILFGLSFLGLFEITLPNKFVNKVDQKSEKGGLVGMFFMAFTLVLVSFSCTGPVVGSILISAAGGEILKPIVGMVGYSAAFAIPFALFAIFPSALNKLPKSGGWLNSVKVVLGLLELALAFKFLSVVDQAYHWHLLNRDVFIIIWISIFFIMFLYLIGKILLPHDSEIKKIGVFRLVLAITTLAFVLYLFLGLSGKALPMLSGILPPKQAEGYSTNNARYSDKLHLPHGLEGYFDLREAICASKEQNKPIFIDATGHGCVNCRQMETSVWSDPKILNKLKNDFIILALYADDRVIELPKEEQYVKDDGTPVKMMRELNNHFLQEKFAIHAQPYYLILKPETKSEQIILKEISAPHEFDMSIENFLSFLNTGLENYKK